MPRNLNRREVILRTKAHRQAALNRPELLQPTTPRRSAAGPMSMAVKEMPPEDRRLIDEALAKRVTDSRR